MNAPDRPGPGESPDQPGKTRTWWHPLLARLLDHVLASAYTVSEEVSVGKVPLRVDILLIRRETGKVSEAGRRELAALLPLLNRFTFIQFKGPTDALERGDLAQLVGCAFLWHSQQVELVPRSEMSLISLAPTLNDGLRRELRVLGGQAVEEERRIFRLEGMPFATCALETDTMAEGGEAVLSLVSRVFLDHRERIIELLTSTGHAALLWYMLQQVQQFRSLGEGFAMQHKDSEYLGEVEDELLTTVLDAIPVEKRLRGLTAEQQEEFLATVPAERLLHGLTPEQQEEFLASIPTERLLHGLTPEQQGELLASIPAERLLHGLTPEQQEELLASIPAEERLRGLTSKEAIQSFTPEAFVAGLSQDQAARLRELLERKGDG